MNELGLRDTTKFNVDADIYACNTFHARALHSVHDTRAIYEVLKWVHMGTGIGRKIHTRKFCLKRGSSCKFLCEN